MVESNPDQYRSSRDKRSMIDTDKTGTTIVRAGTPSQDEDSDQLESPDTLNKMEQMTDKLFA